MRSAPGNGDELSGEQPRGRHQQEIGQKAPERGASGVDAVEQGDPTGTGLEIAPHQVTDQERQRPSHHDRRRR